jgi:hypothetical protein
VECTVEGETPVRMKMSLNNHYNGAFVEPDGRRTRRGYGLEVLERFVREVAYVEFGGGEFGGGEFGGGEFGGGREERARRIDQMRQLHYNDLGADRQVVAAVQALEAILQRHAAGEPDCVVRVNDPRGGLVLYRPGAGDGEVLYAPRV